jgi:N-glycosylase/DNA lyase
MDVQDLIQLYNERKQEIKKRIEFFKTTDPTEELVFCLCTPQSKAKRCWEAVEELKKQDKLFSSPEEIANVLQSRVRFHNTKAKRIVDALKINISHLPEDPFQAREWLVENVKGLGLKEASHFLRNIGKGENLTILDRHILKNLVEFGVIDELPKSLDRKSYLSIENKMKEFSDQIGIPIVELDLLLWSIETGEIFK